MKSLLPVPPPFLKWNNSKNHVPLFTHDAMPFTYRASACKLTLWGFSQIGACVLQIYLGSHAIKLIFPIVVLVSTLI